ncbi:hypothetical protein ACL03H_14985 [Saccharopolyspora sp. MS10]|uniref:hypothetical protein n=1 Tax=Saccharopolyspora sp. MS10 TaxID=3385973 RepID=UPI00399FBF75
MNKPDPGTPIFGELNEELGGLPDIEVHEFDSHSFDFGGGSAESDGAAAAPAKASSRGGRRRKEA